MDIQEKWKAYYAGLESLKRLTIPRKCKPHPSDKVEVHGFCDASMEAYGACMYIRSLDKTSKWHSRFLCSKSRVALLKGATIPRLELSGALLLAQLATKVADSWGIDSATIYLWTDSTIVLGWLNSHSSRLKTFVANRVNQILELTEVKQWRHDNPADIISRGISPVELIRADIWWNGPKWLEEDNTIWQIQPTLMNDIEELPEIRKMKLTLITANPVTHMINQYSEWNHMLRGIAWLRRYTRYIKGDKGFREPRQLQISDLREAKLTVLRIVQQEMFRKEFIALEKGQEVPKNSKLRCLIPFIKNGLILVGGRLQNSNINENRKHPIVLPSFHKITVMIFESYHRELLHIGPQTLLSEVRRQYWPLLGRANARAVVRRCIKCIRACPRFDQPLMAVLPKDRLQCARPFTITGVDFAGPFYVRSGLRRVSEKKSVDCHIRLFFYKGYAFGTG